MRNARTIRNQRRQTTTQVAVATGLEPATINRLETGAVAAPTYETLRTLAEYYGVEIDDLLKEVEA